ncbi:MAG: chemotaxis protein CheW [Polyangiaceae bacterium]
MSARVDLKEFWSAYLAEVEEQQQSANVKLLEIESSAREGKMNPRAVRDLFRALHTIKGLSAMVGVEPAVAIAHRMEGILRNADKSGGTLPLESIDTLLKGMRAIEHRVRELSEGKEASAAPQALLDALDRVESSSPLAKIDESGTLDLEPSILAKLAPFEISLLADGARSGRRAVRADFSPSPTKAERGFSINSVRERLSSIAEIIKVLPVSVPVTKDSPGALSFAILMLSSASDEDLASAVGIEAAALKNLLVTAPLEQSPTSSLAPEADEDDLDAPLPQRRNVVRVDVTRLDDAMENLSTLIVTRSRLARAIATLTASGTNTRELLEIMRDNARQLRDLRASILRVRMVPVAEVLDRIPLLVRGLRRESGKKVSLAIDAGNAELDKGVAERLFPAIVHLVRNAVDHAIEDPAYRLRIGKPEEGLLRISCKAHSNTRLEMTVTDDGRGVDREQVARRVDRELTTDAALLDALCRAGLSTRDQATTTSGRGMGMDIVKRIVVEQLGGELSMKTEPGAGTTFTLRVPLSVAIVDAFTMECANQRFVVPISMVEEILEIDQSKVRYGPSRNASEAVERRERPGILERRGETIPLVDLAAVLHLPLSTSARMPTTQAILVRSNGEPIAFSLDRVIGQQEAVVRPLVDPLVQAPGVAGATDLGDGKPTIVLDLVALGASLARRLGERAA